MGNRINNINKTNKINKQMINNYKAKIIRKTQQKVS